MRVIHLNTNRRWGGGENQILHLLRLTQGEEFRPLLLARPEGPLLAKSKEAGLEAEPFRYFSAYGLLSIGRLAGLLRSRGADILHLHDADAVSLGAAAGRMLRGEAKLVVHRRIASPMRKNAVTRWKYDPRHIAAFVAVSKSAEQSLLDFGISPSKIRVIPSGVDTAGLAPLPDKAAARQALGLESGYWIGTVTTLAPKKNNETFLLAAAKILAKIPDARFLIVGDGPERARLEDMAKALNLDPSRMRFLGYQSQATRYTAVLDLFLFPSVLEGSPGAPKEAMALEIPVIAANSRGNDEIVRSGTGVLVPPTDAEVWADAVFELHKNTAWAREMAKAASAHVRENFSMEQMARKTANLYREIHG